MPLIDLHAPAGAQPPEALGALADRVLQAVHRAEGYAGSRVAAALSWTYLHAVPPAALRQGTGPAPAPLWRIEIAAPEGSLDAAAKPRLAAEIARLVLEAEGTPFGPAAARRIWVLFRDVAEGAWFAGPDAASAAAIRAAVARERALIRT